MSRRLLDIRDLSIAFDTPEGTALARGSGGPADRPGRVVGPGRRVWLRQECDTRSILGLILPAWSRTARHHPVRGPQPAEARREAMRKVRGRKISMIFQDPMTALNPVLPIGYQMAEPL